MQLIIDWLEECKMKKLILTIGCLIILCNSCFAAILDPVAPLVYYYPDTGLLLLDTNSIGIRRLIVSFNDINLPHAFFDVSVNNPLFASYGGPITEWEYVDTGLGAVYFGMHSESGYTGSLRALCQVSSGLTENDFNYVEYRVYPGDYYDSKYADVIIVPEPATMLLLGLGGIALARKRRG